MHHASRFIDPAVGFARPMVRRVRILFSAIKITAMVGLVISGVAINCGAGPACGVTHGGSSSVPGAWGRFLAFWNVFVQAAFSFIGTEIAAVTVGEAENPRRNVPKAIRRVFWRIIIFHLVGILIIGLNVPFNPPELISNSGGTASASPWIIAIKTAGIKGLPSLINAIILVSAWSAGNFDLYASSRTLYALAIAGQLPGFIQRCTEDGLPVWVVFVTSLFGALRIQLRVAVLDEGTILLNPSTPRTEKNLTGWLLYQAPELYFGRNNLTAVTELLKFYPTDPAAGSPYGTTNETFGKAAQYKRLTSVGGGLIFQARLRDHVRIATKFGVLVIPATINTLLAHFQPEMDYFRKGVQHISEIAFVFRALSISGLPIPRPYLQLEDSTFNYWLNFAYTLNPDPASGSYPYWPQYGKNATLLELGLDTHQIPDTFRAEPIEYIITTPSLYN
ncbi:hypothetical protein FRC11_000878 [Ceratobasidium sp. 423]|nr:hypothetical protein FRC11_000878 [Ceratobasidium sp. 423]